MKNFIGSVICGKDRFSKYIAIHADAHNMQLFRDYLDKPKEIIKAYEKYHNIENEVKWVIVNNWK